jgi:hypothetical protein
MSNSLIYVCISIKTEMENVMDNISAWTWFPTHYSDNVINFRCAFKTTTISNFLFLRYINLKTKQSKAEDKMYWNEIVLLCLFVYNVVEKIHQRVTICKFILRSFLYFNINCVIHYHYQRHFSTFMREILFWLYIGISKINKAYFQVSLNCGKFEWTFWEKTHTCYA